jgi:hypothetical protein
MWFRFVLNNFQLLPGSNTYKHLSEGTAFAERIDKQKHETFCHSLNSVFEIEISFVKLIFCIIHHRLPLEGNNSSNKSLCVSKSSLNKKFSSTGSSGAFLSLSQPTKMSATTAKIVH